MSKLSGYSVQVMIGTFAVEFTQVTASIEDNSKAAMSRNRPNGSLRGAVSCSGEITVDTDNLTIMLDAAKSAGSWQDMPEFDIVMNADSGNVALNIELFECLVKISDLLDAESNSEDQLTHSLPYEVTGKEFVKINGVPYAPSADIEGMQ